MDSTDDVDAPETEDHAHFTGNPGSFEAIKGVPAGSMTKNERPAKSEVESSTINTSSTGEALKDLLVRHNQVEYTGLDREIFSSETILKHRSEPSIAEDNHVMPDITAKDKSNAIPFASKVSRRTSRPKRGELPEKSDDDDISTLKRAGSSSAIELHELVFDGVEGDDGKAFLPTSSGDITVESRKSTHENKFASTPGYQRAAAWVHGDHTNGSIDLRSSSYLSQPEPAHHRNSAWYERSSNHGTNIFHQNQNDEQNEYWSSGSPTQLDSDDERLIRPIPRNVNDITNLNNPLFVNTSGIKSRRIREAIAMETIPDEYTDNPAHDLDMKHFMILYKPGYRTRANWDEYQRDKRFTDAVSVGSGRGGFGKTRWCLIGSTVVMAIVVLTITLNPTISRKITSRLTMDNGVGGNSMGLGTSSSSTGAVVTATMTTTRRRGEIIPTVPESIYTRDMISQASVTPKASGSPTIKDLA